MLEDRYRETTIPAGYSECCVLEARNTGLGITAAAVVLNMACHARPAGGGGGPITVRSAPDCNGNW